MKEAEMKSSDWRRLIKTLNEEKLILFLGPEIATTTENVPLINAMTQHLAEKIDIPAELAKELSLGQVCLRYEQYEDNDHYDLEDEVEEFYHIHTDQKSETLNLIASLPFPLCISSSPENGLEQAMLRQGKQPRTDFYHYKKNRELDYHEPTAQEPLVYQLYGSLDEPKSLILTDDDMLSFLVSIIKRTPAIPAYLRSRLLDRDCSFLFVGFGFRNWHVRLLLHLLREHRQSNRSLAIEPDDFYADPQHQSTLFYFQTTHKIRFYNHSWHGFIAELAQRYQNMEPVKEVQSLANKPCLFLCHSNRDQDRVMALGEKIQARGLNVWIDKQDLRGGDQWYKLLIRAISHQVDYVVVMQSTDMHVRPESFFHKEVSTALERQSHFDTGARFIIPARIDDCQPLSALQGLQAIDLTEEQGLDELVSVVEQDWAKRETAKHQREAEHV